MNLKKILFSAGLMVFCMGMFLPVGTDAFADEKPAEQMTILFSGEIIDQNAVSVSGVFPLSFKVYGDEKSKKAILTEKKFVSVVDGQYNVTLNPSMAALQKVKAVYVGVEMDGKELVRMKVSPQGSPIVLDSRIQETKAVELQAGSAFSLRCPAGYVATGLKGTAGENGGIQSLQLVCTKTAK